LIRGTGHIQDLPDPRDLASYDLVRAPAAVLAECEGLEEFLPSEVPDQGASNRCVGFSIASAVYAVLGASGLPQVRPSPGFIYANACRDDGFVDTAVGGILDIGCRPRTAFEAVRSYGMCTESDWPDRFDPTLVPTLDCYQAATDTGKSFRYARVFGSGAARSNEIRRALMSRHAVLLSYAVDERYQNLQSGDWMGPVGGDVGRHYVFAYSYDPIGLRHLGSYGPWHGRSGRIRVGWEITENPEVCTDVMVITMAHLADRFRP
jgi:hypothetical protein